MMMPSRHFEDLPQQNQDLILLLGEFICGSDAPRAGIDPDDAWNAFWDLCDLADIEGVTKAIDRHLSRRGP